MLNLLAVCTQVLVVNALVGDLILDEVMSLCMDIHYCIIIIYYRMNYCLDASSVCHVEDLKTDCILGQVIE